MKYTKLKKQMSFFWSRVAQLAPLCIFSKDVHGLNSLPIISIKYMYTRNISSVFV